MASAKAAASRRLLPIHNHTCPIADKVDNLVLVLPRGGKIFNTTIDTNGAVTQLQLNKTPILNYHTLSDVSLALELSAVGTRYEGATEHVPRANLLDLSAPGEQTASLRNIAIADAWAAIYALFTLYHTNEHIPIRFTATPNAEELMEYLMITGLGRVYQGSKEAALTKGVIFFSRAAFWQGAGTTGYHDRGWLLSPAPVFPLIPSFTRSEMVIAAHPSRPPKPHGGQPLYRRYCAAVGQTLEFVVFDIRGNSEGDGGLSQHMAAFHRWHNDERVNSAWGERGSLDTHREYVERLLADPGVVPIMMSWDGELIGYVQIVWVKENHAAQHYPADAVVGDWERGIHVLVGEEKFLGGGRSELWLRSLVHYIFLADARTNRVIGEPKETNVAIIKATKAAGFHAHAVRSTPPLDLRNTDILHGTLNHRFPI